jgi:hypothetical protein
VRRAAEPALVPVVGVRLFLHTIRVHATLVEAHDANPLSETSAGAVTKKKIAEKAQRKHSI